MRVLLDSNVYLSFYSYTKNDIEELRKLSKLISDLQITLYIPRQIVSEVYRNRDNKLFDAIKKLKDQRINPQFPQICKDYEHYNELMTLSNQYSIKLKEIIGLINEDVNNKTLQADLVIADLFKNNFIIDNDNEIIEKAKFRMQVGNPPGKNNSLGDAVIWETLLKFFPNNENLYFISDDKDYFSLMDEHKLDPFLIAEWEVKKNSKIFSFRTLNEFSKEMDLDFIIKSEENNKIEILINNLVSSRSFTDTHEAISLLSNYSDFNFKQVNMIVNAALYNDQVYRIIFDLDIYDFYKFIVNNYNKFINPTELKTLKELLKLDTLKVN